MAMRKARAKRAGVKVAEYLGQRTDQDVVQIQPAMVGDKCPFMHAACAKVAKKSKPVCSVRKGDGTLWIVCEHRLCATTQKVSLSAHQIDILTKVAQTIFDSAVSPNDVLVRREVPLTVHAGKEYKADYIVTLTNGRSLYPGPDRLVVEMQGGGETSNTQKITSHVKKWEDNSRRSNVELRQEVSSTGTLETNAWRRQQEQFIVKGNVAALTWKGYGIAFCVGAALYDYLWNKVKNDRLPTLRDYNWTLAIVGFVEDHINVPIPGPIPLIVDQNRLLFTNYQTFVHALINQGEPTIDAFCGEFINLNGVKVTVPRDGR